MRKKLILFLMLALFGSTSFLRAEEVTIGSLEGAGNNSYLPMNSLYNYSYSQQIYTAEEVGMAGTINSITMWMYGTATLPPRTFDIYLKEVDKDEFASTTDWITVSASDMVYSGTVAFNNTVAEAYTFTLTTPFVYSGTSNLLIAFNNYTGTWNSGLNGKTFGTTGDPVRAIYVRQDSEAYDPYNPTFTATSTTYQRNVVMLDFSGGSVPTPPTPPVPTGELSITPNPFEMGERPSNAWMEPYAIRILNGGPDNHIEASISDVLGVGAFILTPAIDMDIANGEAVDAIISINDTIPEGEYEEEFTLYFNGNEKDMLQIPVTATVYTAVKPDVVEKRQTISATALPSFSYNLNNLHANYMLQGMTQMKPDAVYYFNLTADSQFEAALSNGGAIYLYKVRSNFHPTTADEPILMAEGQISATLKKGKYYMIVAGDNLNGSTLTGSATAVPAPTELTYLAPENMAHEITAPDTLRWEGGEYATEYQVIFGTTYPPVQVIEDWTAIDEYYGAYPIAELNNSTQYFWQIKVRNNQGEEYSVVEGPVWGFTTTLVPPTNVRLTETEIFTDGSTVVRWDNMGTGGGFSGELTVCDGTSTSTYIPVYGLWMDDYTRNEMIYPAEMLQEMTGGDITSLKYYISSSASGPWTGNVFNVYMMEVDATTLSTYYTSANAQIVYTGGLDGQGTEMIVNLSTPYHYNGGNLLVGYEETTKQTWKSCSFYGVTATGASAAGYSATSLSAVAFNQQNFLPKTTFTCGGKGYRDVQRSIRGYNVYLVSGQGGGGGGVTPTPPPTPPTPGGGWTEGFENGMPAGWNVIDSNNDGWTWCMTSAIPTTWTYYGSLTLDWYRTGTNAICSGSYINGVGALTPDEYLVTVPVAPTAGSTFSFYAAATDASYAADHFGVFVSANGTSNWTMLNEWTLTGKNGGTNGGRASRDGNGAKLGNWYSYSVDLSSYAGQTVYLAIRHFNCNDQYIMVVDDIAYTTSAKGGIETAETAGVAYATLPARAMWDLENSFECTSGYQYGVATDGNNIYTSSWSPNSTSMFYKYDMQGNFIEEFNISGCGQLRGMTYDGQYFYGVANASTVYCVDLANHSLVSSFTTTYGAMRCITYDPQRDGFWVVGNWSGNLTLIDRTGAIVQAATAPTSASDVAYYKDADNVEHVYYTKNAQGSGEVYEYNITTNTMGTTPLFNCATATGTAAAWASNASSGGCFVGTYNGKTCLFVDVQQTPQLINIFELNANAGGGGGNTPVAGEFIKLNDEMLTTNEFTFEPANAYYGGYNFYNMPDGGTIHVTAVYDEGESLYDHGNARLYISGYTSFYGTVHENLGGPAIADVEISFSGTDEFGNNVNYSTTTNANGEYTIQNVKVGTYTAVAEAEGYEVAILSNVTNENLVPAEVNFELHEVYYPVFKVYAEDMDGLMAKVQWSLYDFEPTPGGGGGGGGVTPTPPPTPGNGWTEGFESGMPTGWNVIDSNSDGWTWCLTSAIPTTWTYYASLTLDWYRTGTNAICSGSYINGVGALNPDEYLVTVPVTPAAGSTFSFWAAATDASYAADHFGVFVSANGTSNWTMLNEWTLTGKNGGTNGGRASRDGKGAKLGNWYNYSVDLSSYAGQTVYLAIRHFNCTDQYIMVVDDIEYAASAKGDDRSVNHYNLYRKTLLTQEPIAADDSITLTVENLTDTLYADFDWYNANPGLYQYGVRAVYPGYDQRGNRGGYIIDFETGDFSQFPQVTNSASYPWVVVDGAHSGKGMKSSNGGVASSTSEISATVNYITDGNVSFWAECKGEGTSTIWDKCIFQIDGVEQFCYGANQPGWNEYTYDITAGEHTFTWKYSKDGSVNPTGDYMMVDDINFYYAGGGGGNNPITDITWSNILPKNMSNTVTVRATTTMGTVEGAQVHFVNTTESNSVFEGTFDETGEIVFENFRKGYYMLSADFEGFTCEYDSPTAISIWEDNMEILINFTEKLDPVPEMWVSSTGWARWTDVLPEAGEIAERYIVNMNNVHQGETTNPFMQLDVDGLVNGQTYTAKVAVIYSTGMSAWTTTSFTYQECDGTNPAVDTIYNTEMDVTLTWDGGTPGPGPGPGPTPPPTGGWTEGFESGMPAGWNVIDSNNDGWTWCMTSAIPSTWTYYASLSLDWYRTGTNAICSGSYINGVGALSPDEYLVTAPVTPTAGSTFSFYAAATDASYAADHFGVFVSTNGTSNWTMLNEWTLTGKDGGTDGGLASRNGNGAKLGNWYNYSVDLSSYIGQTIYLAIRHFNCTDMYIMCVDDITYTEDAKSFESADNCGFSAPAAPARAMWDVLKTFNAAEGGQYGVVTDGQYIYTSNWGYSSATHNFYKYDMDGNQIEGFEISGCGTLRGMTYDGEYIYGVANSSTVYIVDLNNHTLVGTFTSAYGAMRCISYDPQRDGFWVVGNWSGNLTLIDRTGAIQFQGPEPTSASDVAYFKDADGVEHVYCFNNADNGVYDYNVTTNTMGGSVFNYSSVPGFQTNASSGGCHIANYGDKLAFYGDIQQSPNLIAICELGAAQGGGGGGSTASSYVANKYNLVVDGEVVASTSDNYITWTCPDYNEHLYQVVWVDANYNISCPEEIVYQIPLTEVSENTVDNTTVYPNPTSGDLHINANGMVRISIVNTLGQMVYDQAVKCDETIVNMARFDAGIYLVNIVTNTGTSVKRVVVTK